MYMRDVRAKLGSHRVFVGIAQQVCKLFVLPADAVSSRRSRRCGGSRCKSG